MVRNVSDPVHAFVSEVAIVEASGCAGRRA